MDRRRLFSVALLGLAISAGGRGPCWGISGTTQVASTGQPVSDRSGWPVGVVEFINDPLRTTGWNPFFSGLPNDVCRYRYRVRDMAQLNRLIASFSEIEFEDLQVVLTPEAAPHSRPHDDDASVEFAIGNQEVIDHWFEHLARDADGRRIFGGRRIGRPFAATAPTLTICVGHQVVDLGQLKVPAKVRVGPSKWRTHRAESDEASEIDNFLKRLEAEGK